MTPATDDALVASKLRQAGEAGINVNMSPTDCIAMAARLQALNARASEAEARVAKLEYDRSPKVLEDALRPLLAEVDSLRNVRAELAAAKRDAERYRWLRDQMRPKGLALIDILQPDGDWSASVTPIDESELDAAIDAAIAAQAKGAP